MQASNPAGESDWSTIRQFSISTTGIDHLQKPDFDFQISPNPAKDRINIQFADPINIKGKIELYIATGKKIAEKQVPAGAEMVELNVLGLKSGVYFCRLILENKSVTKKLIIQ